MATLNAPEMCLWKYVHLVPCWLDWQLTSCTVMGYMHLVQHSRANL